MASENTMVVELVDANQPQEAAGAASPGASDSGAGWKRISIAEVDSDKDESDGSKCEIITFYNHSTDPNDKRPRWSEFQDPVAEERRLKQVGKDFAVIHRQSRVEKDGCDSWITTSIEAQSPRLRTVLDQVFSDYSGWFPDSSPYAVAPPFKPYVHRWDTLKKVCEEAGSGMLAAELQLLRGELEPRITGYLSSLDRIRSTGTVSFSNLWMILAPGCLVISDRTGKTQISKLVQVIFSPKKRNQDAFYRLVLASVNWNGSTTGIELSVVNICEYGDAIAVQKLSVYPVEFASNWEKIEKQVLARGRKWEALRGYHMKAYSGTKYVMERNPFSRQMEEVGKPASGRVIVDAYAHYKVQKKVAKRLFPLDKFRYAPDTLRPKPKTKDDARNDSGSDSDSDSDESSSDPDILEPADFTIQLPTFKTGPAAHAAYKGKETSGRSEVLTPLNDLECVIATPRLKGFDLGVKEWCEFDVDDVKDIIWDTSPYDNLVLPEGEKDLVFAFADRPRLSKQGFDDFVAHKGKYSGVRSGLVTVN
ncbi:hypothetical protein jhhlp_000774 [Lomentospora prolificans]|uniref:DUF7025 domain-containing protein n=1 Tax=Lomentospora prolificans TaxID=41688 RepID=A0A2N3NJE0_9PEZI|nr:hypothetical protein jhhlp_000774 [Lomentospora prolificans]